MNITLDSNAFETDVLNKRLLSFCRANDMDGDVASIGNVDDGGRGEQFLAFMMAHVTSQFQNPSIKNLHLFGRFVSHSEKLAPPDDQCPFVVSGKWRPGHYAGPSAERLRELCAAHLGEGRVFAHPGRFVETIAALPPQSLFCLLYMNCQLCAPTTEALDGLFGRGMIAEGGHILFADWDANRSSPRYGERRAWAECVAKYDVTFSYGGAFGLSSQIVIVHDYRGAPFNHLAEQ